jgi:hypothetical protein
VEAAGGAGGRGGEVAWGCTDTSGAAAAKARSCAGGLGSPPAADACAGSSGLGPNDAASGAGSCIAGSTPPSPSCATPCSPIGALWAETASAARGLAMGSSDGTGSGAAGSGSPGSDRSGSGSAGSGSAGSDRSGSGSAGSGSAGSGSTGPGSPGSRNCGASAGAVAKSAPGSGAGPEAFALLPPARSARRLARSARSCSRSSSVRSGDGCGRLPRVKSWTLTGSGGEPALKQVSGCT